MDIDALTILVEQAGLMLGNLLIDGEIIEKPVRLQEIDLKEWKILISFVSGIVK